MAQAVAGGLISRDDQQEEKGLEFLGRQVFRGRED